MSARAVGIHTMMTRTSATHRFIRYIFTVVFIERLRIITITTRIFPKIPTRNIKLYSKVDVRTMYKGGSGGCATNVIFLLELVSSLESLKKIEVFLSMIV